MVRVRVSWTRGSATACCSVAVRSSVVAEAVDQGSRWASPWPEAPAAASSSLAGPNPSTQVKWPTAPVLRRGRPESRSSCRESHIGLLRSASSLRTTLGRPPPSGNTVNSTRPLDTTIASRPRYFAPRSMSAATSGRQRRARKLFRNAVKVYPVAATLALDFLDRFILPTAELKVMRDHSCAWR